MRPSATRRQAQGKPTAIAGGSDAAAGAGPRLGTLIPHYGQPALASPCGSDRLIDSVQTHFLPCEPRINPVGLGQRPPRQATGILELQRVNNTTAIGGILCMIAGAVWAAPRDGPPPTIEFGNSDFHETPDIPEGEAIWGDGQ